MNEIITYGQNYDLTSSIKVFISSALKTGNNLTIIASNLSPTLLDFLKNHKVNVVDAHELANKFNVKTSLSPYTLKMIYFFLYCKHVSTASNVYLCDFTDIYFQKNPFELIKNNKPYITGENKTIENCSTNSTWISVCYNYDIFNLLSKKEILNGGNIFGNIQPVTALLKELCIDMTHIISRIGNYQNIDQASLNKSVYFDRHRYNILNNFEIYNLANHSTAKFETHNETILLNDNISHVIHQYDAVKSLETYLFSTYGQ
jgi:hypothetical protein